jgi:hypothetical protein
MSNNQQILNDVASDLYTTLSLNEDLKSKIILLPKSENSSEFVLNLYIFKTPIIKAKNKQKVIADFTPRYTYLPAREYHNRS